MADAAGADAVVLTTGSVDPHNGKCVRASAGSLFHVPVLTGLQVESSVASLRAVGLQVWATAASGEGIEGLAAELANPTAWLFGNEARGLPTGLALAADRVVSVPIYGRAESLNLSTAAAVCLYASALNR